MLLYYRKSLRVPVWIQTANVSSHTFAKIFITAWFFFKCQLFHPNQRYIIYLIFLFYEALLPNTFFLHLLSHILYFSLFVAVSAHVPTPSLFYATTTESHFIPPQVYLPSLSVYLPLAHCVVSLSSHLIHPVGLSVSPFFFSLCKSPPFPSLLYFSHLPLLFLCVPDSEPVETQGYGGLTLIDASDRREEVEEREGWLWADKVNSVFPSSLSPGSN